MEYSELLISLSCDGHHVKLRRILEARKETNVQNVHGYTPLMAAAANFQTKVMQVLLAFGADPNFAPLNNRGPIHSVVGSPVHEDSESDQLACLQLLIDAGARLNSQTTTGETPLMSAAWFGCTSAVKTLLQHGARQELVDSEGRTALDLVLIKSNSQVVKLLTQHADRD